MLKRNRLVDVSTSVHITGTKRCKKDKGVESQIKVQRATKSNRKNPFQVPPPYKKLVGELRGYISRRINIQHRLIYKVYDDEKVVKVIRLWTHYSE